MPEDEKEKKPEAEQKDFVTKADFDVYTKSIDTRFDSTMKSLETISKSIEDISKSLVNKEEDKKPEEEKKSAAAPAIPVSKTDIEAAVESVMKARGYIDETPRVETQKMIPPVAEAKSLYETVAKHASNPAALTDAFARSRSEGKSAIEYLE